ncbi:MAG: dockerin type I repeat-containing protein, partial [Lachnospiraceae bacterium]
DQEKLQIMVPDSVCVAKGEKKPLIKNIVGVFDYNVKPVATVEGIHAEVVTPMNGESYTVLGKKIGTTNGKVTYQSGTISVPIEVTGIDENIPVETGKGNSEFINDADGNGFIAGETIDILRENKELWQVYPEMKKVMSDVSKYVAGDVYEPGFGNGANYKHIINGKNELWDGEKKIADHVVASDYHYALTSEGELKDLYNTKGHSETNVKDWGRKRSATNHIEYAGTYLLKQDGTLWYRDDVKQEEPINEFVQMDSDVKQLGKISSVRGITVEGYLKNTGVFVIEGKESFAGVQEVTNAGVMAADGFYLWDANQTTFVRVCDFNVKSSFCKGRSTDSYDWGLVDTKDQLWRVTIGGAEITESVKLISDQYSRPAHLHYQGPFFIGMDGKCYDRDGKVFEIDQTKEEYYIGNDQMLCHYGVPILSNVVRTIRLQTFTGTGIKEAKMAIRTDGTVWNVEGIPTLVTNFMIPGVEIPKEKVEAAVQTITTAPSGSEVPVVMEGATEAPKAILEAAKGKDVTVALNMGGYTWEINGKNITAAALQNINLEVKQGTDNIPQSVITETAGTKPVKQLSLTHEGEFGFTATLTVNVGVEYAGQNGTLYYYHGGTLEYVGTQKIDAEGNIQEQFSHASDYAVVIGDMQMLGDVTNDGNINLADLMKVLQSVSGKLILTKEETIAADVNRDIVINLKDLMKILQYVSGKIDVL